MATTSKNQVVRLLISKAEVQMVTDGFANDEDPQKRKFQLCELLALFALR